MRVARGQFTNPSGPISIPGANVFLMLGGEGLFPWARNHEEGPRPWRLRLGSNRQGLLGPGAGGRMHTSVWTNAHVCLIDIVL